MGLFDFFKKKQVKLTEEQKKWNKMWDLWVKGEVEAPYLQLMTYHSEVNNGGHGQYFLNLENTDNFQKELSILKTVLSEKFVDNLQKAYQAHLVLEKADNDQAEEMIERCDDVFYENEEEIINILQKYANKISL